MVQTPSTDILTFFNNVSIELQAKPENTNQVILEAFVFAAHCDLGNEIIQPILKQDAALQDELWEFRTKDFYSFKPVVGTHESHKTTLKAIVKLVSNVKQRHDIFKTEGYTYNNDERNVYISFLKDETAKLRQLLNILYLHKVPGTPALKIQQFQPIMSNDAYDYWVLLSTDVVVGWEKFLSIYNVLFGSVEPQYKTYVKNFLCDANSNVTAFTFISLIEQFGFPFGKNNGKTALGEEGRVEVTKMMMELMRELASSEMRDHLLTIYDWFKGIERTSTDDITKRANEWAHIIKKSPRTEITTAKITKTDEQQRADNIDLARRAISLFYQRYMVLWKIGPAAREVIKGVDTPGKTRMRDFLTYVLPLDKANLTVVIGVDPKSWDQKRPKVYDFVDTLVNPALQ
ncbi:hypothetical protein INT45_010098 [Circinella minor]|uniref:Uncharacterized protein n=1 Tax=Circinella minor TaxID=1195481 RepID=A0A8H7SC00_9FUNG|nr:hypothetical protein INT45_010098 [Circinella minor]